MKGFIVLNIFLVVLVVHTCYNGCEADHQPEHTGEKDNSTTTTTATTTTEVVTGKAQARMNRNHTGGNHTSKHHKGKTSCAKKIMSVLSSTIKEVRQIKSALHKQSKLINAMTSLLNRINRSQNQHSKLQKGKGNHKNQNQKQNGKNEAQKGKHGKDNKKHHMKDSNKDDTTHRSNGHQKNIRQHGSEHKKKNTTHFQDKKGQKPITKFTGKKGDRTKNSWKKCHKIHTCSTENITLNCTTGYIHVTRGIFGYDKFDNCSNQYQLTTEVGKQCKPADVYPVHKGCNGEQKCTISKSMLTNVIKENNCKQPSYTLSVYCCREKKNSSL